MNRKLASLLLLTSALVLTQPLAIMAADAVVEERPTVLDNPNPAGSVATIASDGGDAVATIIAALEGLTAPSAPAVAIADVSAAVADATAGVTAAVTDAKDDFDDFTINGSIDAAQLQDGLAQEVAALERQYPSVVKFLKNRGDDVISLAKAMTRMKFLAIVASKSVAAAAAKYSEMTYLNHANAGSFYASTTNNDLDRGSQILQDSYHGKTGLNDLYEAGNEVITDLMEFWALAYAVDMLQLQDGTTKADAVACTVVAKGISTLVAEMVKGGKAALTDRKVLAKVAAGMLQKWIENYMFLDKTNKFRPWAEAFALMSLGLDTRALAGTFEAQGSATEHVRKVKDVLLAPSAEGYARGCVAIFVVNKLIGDVLRSRAWFKKLTPAKQIATVKSVSTMIENLFVAGFRTGARNTDRARFGAPAAAAL